MSKSKKNIPELEINKTDPHKKATESVDNFMKYAHTKESATLPGLGSKKK